MILLDSKDIMSVEGTTQGDNLAMSFYALGIAPMPTILRITSPNVSQVSLADDVTGAGTLEKLKTWWDNVITQGTKFGYYVNQSKSWLIKQRKISNMQKHYSEIQTSTSLQKEKGILALRLAIQTFETHMLRKK